jgi:SAM-dependent methyltransferase
MNSLHAARADDIAKHSPMTRCPRCQSHAIARNVCTVCAFTPEFHDGFQCFAPEVRAKADSYDASFFAELVKYEPTNFWFRARNALICHVLRNAPKQADFLEVGCGTGFVLQGVGEAFPEWRMSGSELFTRGLQFARARNPQAQLLQMDATRMPFENTFDVIGAFDVIEHIEDDELVLAQMFEALRSDGLVVITVPQHAWLWSVNDDEAHHVRRYARGELEAKLTTAGFSIQYSTSFVSLLLPVMSAARLVKRAEAQRSPLREFQISSPVNRTLSVVMDIERALVRAGVRFPFGGSRLVVGRKK